MLRLGTPGVSRTVASSFCVIAFAWRPSMMALATSLLIVDTIAASAAVRMRPGGRRASTTAPRRRDRKCNDTLQALGVVLKLGQVHGWARVLLVPSGGHLMQCGKDTAIRIKGPDAQSGGPSPRGEGGGGVRGRSVLFLYVSTFPDVAMALFTAAAVREVLTEVWPLRRTVGLSQSSDISQGSTDDYRLPVHLQKLSSCAPSPRPLIKSPVMKKRAAVGCSQGEPPGGPI